MNGVLAVIKPKNMSSNSVLTKLKKHFNISKIGHFGTLDPLAQGLLVVGIGKGTRLFDYFASCNKEYIATMQFGKETTTLDLEGEIVKEDNKSILLSDFINVCKSFIGGYDQFPPNYSAKKIDGHRAYDLARKGIDVQLKSKFVDIHNIYDIKLLDKNTYQFTVTCGSGTYIRSLVRDIAYKLNTVATMTNLIRTKCCNCEINNAIHIDKINSTNIDDYLISFDKVLGNVPKLILDTSLYKDLVSGRPIQNVIKDNREYLLYCNKELFGIAKSINNKLSITYYLHD